MEQGLNLIQQLQASPKWKEFEEWYKNKFQREYNVPIWNIDGGESFEAYPFCMQKGVFEKFITETSDFLFKPITSKIGVHSITLQGLNSDKVFYSFEELLIWYFNN